MTTADKTFAAIDLGSNSFHMVVAEEDGNSIRIVDSLRHPVRLGEGLDKSKNIKAETFDRGLQTINEFAQRLRGIPKKRIRAVGTNTLRRAKNRKTFMLEAEDMLGRPIEIISGREEARLIYSSVSHTLPELNGKRLVIDIGGGSTELIIGKKLKPCLMESINIGCVSFSKRFFPDSEITKDQFKKAVLSAQLELEPIHRNYRKKGWTEAIGCSGTIKAISRLHMELGLSDGVITLAGLVQIQEKICKAGDVGSLNLQQISKDRAQVLPGGLAVLKALMMSLDIDTLDASQVALREGLIYEMIGKTEHYDTQAQTIAGLIERYSIDEEQSARIETTARRLFDLVAVSWDLDISTDLQQLVWAVQLHEVGLGISHSHYHKHGAYVLENADLLGFSIAEQTIIAFLVRFHRRKLDTDALAALSKKERYRLGRLLALLRVSVLLHRGRHDSTTDELNFKVKSNQLSVITTQEWLDEHPLTASKLLSEADRLNVVDIKLKVKT